MQKKIATLAIVFLLLPINLSAQTIFYDPETGVSIENASSVCANEDYVYQQTTASDKSIIFLDKDNNYLSSKIVNQTEFTFSFPSGISLINVLVVDFKDDKIDYGSFEKYTYNIEDCGNSTANSEVKIPENKLKIVYKDNIFNATYEGDSSIKYQTGESKVLKSLPKKGVKIEQTPTVIQLDVRLTDNEHKYYEIELINKEEYFIREVDTLQAREIKLNPSVSLKSLVILVLTLVLFIYFRKKLKRLKKKEKIRKRRNDERKLRQKRRLEQKKKEDKVRQRLKEKKKKAKKVKAANIGKDLKKTKQVEVDKAEKKSKPIKKVETNNKEKELEQDKKEVKKAGSNSKEKTNSKNVEKKVKTNEKITEKTNDDVVDKKPKESKESTQKVEDDNEDK